jgi:CDP-diacylglycerol--glycerol-3-phosphate 3-phosphatidyltransferase
VANLITTFRLCLLFIVVWLAYNAPPHVQLLTPVLLAVAFALDAVDGYVARRRGEESLFGSIYDIAADRIVENVLWVALADLDLVPVWVALVFITRGILVDAVRSVGASEGRSPFSLTRSAIGRFLVGGRFMRSAYAVLKAVAFAWMFALQPLPSLAPELWPEWGGVLQSVGFALVYSAVVLCLLRGLPVLLEFGAAGSRQFSSRSAGGAGVG